MRTEILTCTEELPNGYEYIASPTLNYDQGQKRLSNP